MAYDAKKIYYRFDDHLSRLVLDTRRAVRFRPKAKTSTTACRPPRTTRACS